jgi:uncharacterized membrane protein YeaQ/YmgE (transglycosylase-associated protein family)
MDERGFCGWICFGFFAGLIARAILPGDQNMGMIATTLLGVAGAFVGGAVAAFFTGGNLQTFAPASFVGAVLGAIGILALGELLFRKTRRR